MTLTKLPSRQIGSLTVGAQGLGCLGMTEFYGPTDEAESLRTIHRALELGVTLLDTADVYAFGANEELIGKAIADRRDTAVVATKFGVQRPGPGVGVGIRGDAEYVRSSCEASLRRLGVDHIDLFYLTRVDTSVEIEETVGALADLVHAGKIREYGLSEAGVTTIRRAHAVHPVAALQTEWSLWSRDIEQSIAPVCRELGIAIVPYAPLGRGFLSGSIRTVDVLGENDFRRIAQPRFLPDNLATNLALVDRVAALAGARGLTAAQWALAWLHHRGPDVVPIPGTRRRGNLEENVDAAFLGLSAPELAAIEAAVPAGDVAGERWNEHSMSFIGL
ncbi:aldo/keto reductase [Actinokineospora sp. NBRC 105648]|uniref:aldo/keto reductase n=1 Tax=Actinokineospora sp. NBRC 105648 TaxID=3032206 RepID=UPI00249FC586|nr:aldo/keto reductase [Actinokineospora sp. NBRC 105648]GLZ40825.1 aldo/keto reductase [Actinokineospora sp. NBRC 105648]